MEQLVSSAMEGRARRNPFKESTPDLPQAFRDVIQEIGGFDAVFVMQKTLSPADTRYLVMPFREVKGKFFKAVRRSMPFSHSLGIPVLFIEPSLNVREMSLCMSKDVSKTTPNSKPPFYMLMDNWDVVKKRNGLKTGALVQLWMFRIEGDERQIGFALVRGGK